jgi:hypothetical protein
MTYRGRTLSDKEAEELARMARSRTLAAGLVRRAQIVQHAADGLSAPGIAAKMGLCGATVRFWLKCFTEHGLGGLEGGHALGAFADLHRRGAQHSHRRGTVSAYRVGPAVRIVDPRLLGGLLGRESVALKHSRVGKVLLAEELEWRQEETWLGARVDREFEHKRGQSSASTSTRPRAM